MRTDVSLFVIVVAAIRARMESQATFIAVHATRSQSSQVQLIASDARLRTAACFVLTASGEREFCLRNRIERTNWRPRANVPKSPFDSSGTASGTRGAGRVSIVRIAGADALSFVSNHLRCLFASTAVRTTTRSEPHGPCINCTTFRKRGSCPANSRGRARRGYEPCKESSGSAGRRCQFPALAGWWPAPGAVL